MRYDTLVYFQKNVSGEYNPDTGNYEDDTIKEAPKRASVMNTGTEMIELVYGSIRQGSLTIQLQNHYTEPFSRVRIGDKIYKVDHARKLRTKHVFVVSEV